MEYFDWLEQEAEEQRREERQEQAQRFVPSAPESSCCKCGQTVTSTSGSIVMCQSCWRVEQRRLMVHFTQLRESLKNREA